MTLQLGSALCAALAAADRSSIDATPSMRRLLTLCSVATSAPAWLPVEPSASCLPDPFEGLDAVARENAEVAAAALDATTQASLRTSMAAALS